MAKSVNQDQPRMRTPTSFGRGVKVKSEPVESQRERPTARSERSLLILGAYACLKQYETFVTSSLADVTGLTESLVKMPNFEETMEEVIDDMIPDEGLFEATDPYKRLAIMVMIATWSQINVNKINAVHKDEVAPTNDVVVTSDDPPVLTTNKFDDVVVTSNDDPP